MSTILKALQKVEELSNRQEARQGTSDPLWGGPQANSRRRFCSRWLLLLFLAVSVGGIGFLSLSGNQEETGIPNTQSSGPPPDAEILERTPGDPEEKTSVVQVEPMPDRQSDHEQEKEQVKEKPVEVAISVAAIPQTVKKLPERRERKSAGHSTTRTRRFLVTGIAYQENRAVRFAIINDRAMGEGETIQGAVVQEILEDRVRFAKSGATFEVLLEGSGR